MSTNCCSPIRYLSALALCAAFPSLALPQASALPSPQNARAKTYAPGWECDPGYRERDGVCAGIAIPADAYATSSPYGRGWECERGYRLSGETCVVIPVPLNAYLNGSGRAWSCERGFRKVDETC